MSIHIDQVLDYLDEQLVCMRADNMHSLMEMLHNAYTMYNAIDSEKLREKFRNLRTVLNMLPEEHQDSFFTLVCEICMEHEVLAFSQGVVVGMLLMNDVDRVLKA